MFTVYSTGCPQCKVLIAKLNEKTIPYEVVSDIDVMIEKGIQSVPIIEAHGKLYPFKEALELIKEW